jgi:hypothetical protein
LLVKALVMLASIDGCRSYCGRTADEHGGLPATRYRIALVHYLRADSAAVMASPRPTRYAPRSQAFSPCRGSDPDSCDRRPRRREPELAARAVAAARCRCNTNPGSVGTVASRSMVRKLFLVMPRLVVGVRGG